MDSEGGQDLGGSLNVSRSAGSADLRHPNAASEERVARLLRLFVGAVAVIGLVTTVLLGLIHLADRYAVLSTSGVLMALADEARRGVLFPPLIDGPYFGGTRYMPGGTVLHAALSAATGEYLVSGKLLSGISSALLCLLVYRLVRRLGTDRILALGLAATVVVGQVGILAALSIRPEAIPVALGLVALVAATRAGTAAITLSALLCVIAVLTKASAVTAPIAILIWLAGRNRHAAIRFLLTFAVGGLVAFIVLNVASDGRMVKSLLELGGSGITASNLATAGLRVLEYAAKYSPASLLLAPLAVLAIQRTAAGRGLSVYQIALMVSVVILAVVFGDQGADYNHLLEVVVLVAIVVGEALGQSRGAAAVAYRGLAVPALAIGLVLSSGAGPGFDLALATKHMVSDGSAMYDAHPLATVDTRGAILSDDPYVPLSIGQRPVVLDSFMLARIAERHPDLTNQLADRIRRAEFDTIVLRREVGTPDADAAYTTLELGASVYEAITEGYRLESVIRDRGHSHLIASRDFFVYVPGGAP